MKRKSLITKKFRFNFWTRCFYHFFTLGQGWWRCWSRCWWRCWWLVTDLVVPKLWVFWNCRPKYSIINAALRKCPVTNIILSATKFSSAHRNHPLQRMLLFSTLVFSSVIAYNMRNLAMFPKEQGSDQGQLRSLKVIEVFNDFKFKPKNFLWLINYGVTFDEKWSIFWSIFELIKDNEINVGPKSIIPTSTPQGIDRQSGWVKPWK